MRRLALLLLIATAACGSRPGSRSVAPGSSSVAPGAAVPPSTPPAVPPSTLPDPTPLELARLHAPYYRFNAWIANERSLQNRNEDLFPMSVARFFEELDANAARVVVIPSNGPVPSVNQVKPATKRPVIDAARVDQAPRNMAGDAPGTAPAYVHVWEDLARRVRNPDGSGEDAFFIEYWTFFPQDQSSLQIWYLSGIAFPIGGHRGDWEGTCFLVAKVRGPGGAFQRSEIRRGYYNRHGWRHSVEPSELELVDDAGARSPSGAHPSIYVSVGKHASYPEPGAIYDMTGTAPFVDFDEFFLGNGATWRAWTTPLLDLEGPVSPEFSSPALLALVAPGVALTDWRDFPGRWGGEKGGAALVSSPKGPRFHSKWGVGDQATSRWSTERTGWGMKLGAVPAVVPPPVPTRS